ncbi:TPA: hypothetical protein ACGU7P_002123 [Vibrio vulnificus]|uniref:hypothetical protein n=1 Tax=Vibrio vulnificus TaxID=672 RepID=UPI0032EFBC4C
MHNMILFLLFMFTFFPFVSLFPIATDTQPIAPLLSVIFIVLCFINGLAKKWHAFVILYTMTFCLYINPFGVGDIYFNKIFALLTAVLLYVSYSLCSKETDVIYSTIKVTIVVYLVFSIFTMMFPSAGLSIQSLLVRNVNSVEFGYRGISTFSTEPGLFSGVILALYAIANAISYKFTNRELFFISVSVLFLLAASRSGTAIAMLVIYLFFKFFNVKTMVSFSIVCLAIYTTIIFNMDFFDTFLRENFGRLGSILFIVITDPERILSDSSIFYRIYALYVGLLIFLENPLGVGFGDVKVLSDIVVSEHGTLSSFYADSKFGFRAVSSLGYYISALGIFFICPMVYLFMKSKAPLENKALAFSMISFSYSIAFPLIWLLLALDNKPTNEVK